MTTWLSRAVIHVLFPLSLSLPSSHRVATRKLPSLINTQTERIIICAHRRMISGLCVDETGDYIKRVRSAFCDTPDAIMRFQETNTRARAGLCVCATRALKICIVWPAAISRRTLYRTLRVPNRRRVVRESSRPKRLMRSGFKGAAARTARFLLVFERRDVKGSIEQKIAGNV